MENKSVFNYLNFLKEVVIRDIKKKYYKSILGVIWTVLNPLLMMIVISVVFSTLFKRNIVNYPVYYMTGILFFNFNSEATRQALGVIVANSSLIRKMYIPKFMFVISNVCVSVMNLLFSLIALFIVMLVTNHPITPYILLLPIPMIYIIMFTTGLSLLLAAYGVFFRDLNHLYGIFVTVWVYLTPIFYPASIISQDYRFLWDLNPLYHFINVMRDLVYIGVMPSERSLIISSLFSIITLLFGALTFKEKQDKFFLYI